MERDIVDHIRVVDYYNTPPYQAFKANFASEKARKSVIQSEFSRKMFSSERYMFNSYENVPRNSIDVQEVLWRGILVLIQQFIAEARSYLNKLKKNRL